MSGEREKKGGGGGGVVFNTFLSLARTRKRQKGECVRYFSSNFLFFSSERERNDVATREEGQRGALREWGRAGAAEGWAFFFFWFFAAFENFELACSRSLTTLLLLLLASVPFALSPPTQLPAPLFAFQSRCAPTSARWSSWRSASPWRSPPSQLRKVRSF